MEQVMGQVIVHKIFGRGVITAFDERYFTVRFEDKAIGDKRFLFPGAFASNIIFENEILQKNVMELVEHARLDHQRYTAAIVLRCKQEACAHKQKKIVRNKKSLDRK